MVIGSGLIAHRFADFGLNANVLFFAGRVNDSAIKDEAIFAEEEKAVQAALSKYPELTFVYVSSCSVLDPEMTGSPYTQHKARMEKLVQGSAQKYWIFRLPQILGLADADSSLVNYLVRSIQAQKPFELWGKAKRNLIDIDDVHDIVSELLRTSAAANKTINVASPIQTPVLQLAQEIEGFLSLSANYSVVDKGSEYQIDISEIAPVIEKLKIEFGPGYVSKALKKYFAHLVGPSKLLSIIVPTYNEEHGIDEFYRRTKIVLGMLEPRFRHEIIFVNDFSADNTYKKLEQIALKDPTVKLINFSRNFGNQIGITAGIDFSKGDIAVVIDDDLQDPPEIMLNLISKWDKGYKVVYGVRPKRQGVNPFFKLAAKLYYRIITLLSDTKIPNDTGDFRLIDRVVIKTLKEMREESRYYRGMVAWVGFPQIGVEYERDRRYAGVSTFSFKKYVNFALNGLTSFTEKPLYFSSLAGLFITAVSFVFAMYLMVSKIMDPTISIRGWTSISVMVLFFGGIQLLSVGILGVYIGKIYREVKGRPLYIIQDTKNLE